MKKILVCLALVLIVSAGCLVYYPNDRVRPGTTREDPYEYESDRAPYGSLDIGYFYDYMQPYGQWVSYAPYGYIWIPGDVGYKWRPYTRGRWTWTDYGWTWVSLERWGWLAFHYGRWGWDRRLGWFWVPDVVWGPAWVAWRWGDAHIGWAPLPPGSDFHPGRGFGRRSWDIPGHHWSFVRGRDFLDRSLDRYVLPNERNVTIINFTDFDVNINIRGDRVFNEGVDVDRVGRLTNRTVDRYSLKEAHGDDQERLEGRDVVLYKPNVAANETARPKQVLTQEKAADEFDNERNGRLFRRMPQDEEVELRRTHKQEKELMEESQELEINEIRRKTEVEKNRIQAPAEKQKLEEEAKSKVAELKKKHEEEKAELTQRQKGEEAKTKRAPIKKKIEKL